MSTGAMIGACTSAGSGSSSKYSSRASRRLASACSMLSPWLATSTCRQRATYQSPSCVIAAVNWISATMVQQLLERAFGPDAGHFALVGGGAAQVACRVDLVADQGGGVSDGCRGQALTAQGRRDVAGAHGGRRGRAQRNPDLLAGEVRAHAQRGRYRDRGVVVLGARQELLVRHPRASRQRRQLD